MRGGQIDFKPDFASLENELNDPASPDEVGTLTHGKDVRSANRREGCLELAVFGRTDEKNPAGCGILRFFNSPGYHGRAVDGLTFESGVKCAAERIFTDDTDVEGLISAGWRPGGPVDELAEVGQVGGFYLIFAGFAELGPKGSDAGLQEQDKQQQEKAPATRSPAVHKATSYHFRNATSA
ncbi:MAG TPA: hypothetical protein VGH38_24285 [Bryobacteraceae bacterium]